MIRRLNNREYKIFAACIGVLMVCFYYKGLIEPLKETEDVLNEEILIHQKQLNADLRIIQQAEFFEERYQHYRKQLTQPGTDEEAVSSILSEIEKTAAKLQLSVTDLKPNQVERGDFDNRFLVSLTIKSELSDVTRFLYTVQQKPHLFGVEALEFEQFSSRNRTELTTRLVLGKTFISQDAEDGIKEGKRWR